MTNLNQLNAMKHLLQVLIEKIGKRTSKGFATISISKAVMNLRNEYDCFNYILINENRYTEGIKAITVSEEIGSIDSYKFYSAMKALIEKTTECFDTTADIFFTQELRESLQDIFYTLDNLDKEKKDNMKQKIMLVDDNQDLIKTVIKGFNKISNEYEITGVNSGVECFDLLTSGYTPKLILLDIMMPNAKGWNILTRLKGKSAWKDIPVIFITAKIDSFSKDFSKLSAQDYITKPFEIRELRVRIDKVLKQS